MEHFLICANPSCRFVVDLKQARKPIRRSELSLSECPECGSEWLANCPSCAEPLSVTWHGHHAHCAQCHRKFRAAAAA